MNLKEFLTTLTSLPSIFSKCIPRLISFVAFLPGEATYSVKIRKLDETEELIFDLNETGQTILRDERYFPFKVFLDVLQKYGKICPFFTTTSRGNKLFCLKLSPIAKPTEQFDKRYTIVYSHPNACDLGIMFGFLCNLSLTCDCDVVGYDYSGYGMSSGKPSERNIYADIESVFRTLINKFKIQENMIILYGESIGTVPTIDLASKSQFSPGGVIIQSPIMSGIRVFYNYNRPTWIFDPFPNIEKISLIRVPVLVIHGMKDSVVSVYHGISLYQRCKYKVSPLWIKDADHSDIRIFTPVYPRIFYFLKECYRFQSVDNFS